MLQQNRRNSTLDALKGICIILVVITHYKWTDSERLNFLFPFWVDMAVPIFMIITGYVYTKSFERHSIDSIESAYDFELVLSRIIRFTVPFLIAYIIEEIAFIVYYGEINPVKSAYRFLVGGSGPGSYYFPVMIQFVFFFPIIYFIIRKYKEKGFISCLVINFMYELVQRAYGMNEECYRMLVFRYTLVISFGCYMAISRNNIKTKMLIFFEFTGTIYIILYKYLGLKPLMTIYWTGTSYIASMFIIPFVYLVIKKDNLSFKLLENIGKASYDIFLVQMVYYKCAVWIVYRITSYAPVVVIINIVICSLVGIVFFNIEKKISKLVSKRILRINSQDRK